jgi:hypothetical protein
MIEKYGKKGIWSIKWFIWFSNLSR